MERVILVGLSGSGKSSVAEALGRRLGFDVVDTDAELTRLFAAPPADVFARYGEPVFRAAEREVVRAASARPKVVVATGGGVAADEANWPYLRPESVIVHLTADDDALLERLRRQIADDPSQSRPLLDAPNPASRLRAMREQRQAYYQRADVTIDTSRLSLDEVVGAIVRAVDDRQEQGTVPVTSIGVPTGRSDLYVAPGLLERVGDLARHRWPEAGRAWIVSDANVATHWAPRLARAFESAGFGVETLVVPAGEASKSMSQVDELVGAMLSGRIDRRDIVVALGGGVVGDLAGFAASIVLRGVGLVQVPTSLLAMVDSSVGGKTGVNHAMGKNLIGTFYQPQLVVADPAVLDTMPEREFRAGWAEIVKHAMIEVTAIGAPEPGLLPLVERTGPSVHDLDLLTRLLRANVLLKATVVRIDERETGPRRLLNYGHTLGHAIEAAGYRYLHGEAIALGMRAVARLALRLGTTTPELVRRQDALLDAAGLPDRFEGSLEAVLDRLGSDKKAVRGRLTWILPADRPGRVDITQDVPMDAVTAVMTELGATPALA